MDYVAPTTIEEAVGALASSPDSRVFAGATDLIPQIRSGRPEPGLLVDLKRIDRLTHVTEGDASWTIGAAAPTSRLTEDPAFSSQFPGLSEAAGLIGSDQIQNRSSLGGNLCNASPAADSVPAMLVNQARAVVATADGTRTIARGAMEDAITGEKVAIEARGSTPLSLALGLAKSMTQGRAFARSAVRALLPRPRRKK